MGEKSVKKARLRVIGGGRVVNPRTGVEDGKGEVQAGSEQYVPLLVSPHTAAGLYHLDPWFSAAVDAISTGVATAEVFPEFQAKSPEEKADSKALQGMAAFLENTPRDQMTVAERLGALDADFSLFGYCAFEVARGSDKMPVAWYHVPGATVRAKKKGGYVQVVCPLCRRRQQGGAAGAGSDPAVRPHGPVFGVSPGGPAGHDARQAERAGRVQPQAPGQGGDAAQDLPAEGGAGRREFSTAASVCGGPGRGG